jgi:anti-anti-sigma factor
MTNKIVEMTSARGEASKQGQRVILSPRGSLTCENCEEFRGKIEHSIKQGKTEIILDCHALSFFDSEGLELLLRTGEEMENKGGSLKIVGLGDVCRDILIATRLMTFFQIYDDIHGAIRDGL